jgi:hypothetical protein
MNDSSFSSQTQTVSSFQELISTPFQGIVNALCWERKLEGDFLEIIEKVETTRNITELSEQLLIGLNLTEQGSLAREVLLEDMSALKAHGAAPVLNIISHYERDDFFFPTDVYSFHVDRSPIPTDTFLCTYYGAPSEIVSNNQAEQKVLIPEIRAELKKLYKGPDEGFEAFLTEYFFDLHYQVKPGAQIISLDQSNIWRLAIDHPESKVPPCLHRAPKENSGEPRLLLIC